MTTTPIKATKADLQAEIDQLKADLKTANDDNKALREYTEWLESVDLNQRMWVCKRLDAESLYTAGTTKDGRPSLKFTAQRSKKDREGKFVSGAWKNMVAYGYLATKAQQLIDSGDILLDFKAFESTSKGADGRSYSDWVLLDVSGTKQDA
mgnify:CR=1 FL=1|tara:strand:+ start:413 stop:865 length:453 start_codon:yes stop_codon:yes gene_type:complete